PDSLTPSWGSDNTLWFAVEGHDNNSSILASAAPPGYVNFETLFGDSSGAGLGVAQNYNTTATENPGAFTMGAEQTFAFTVAVKPAGAGGTFTRTASDSFSISDTVTR